MWEPWSAWGLSGSQLEYASEYVLGILLVEIVLETTLAIAMDGWIWVDLLALTWVGLWWGIALESQLELSSVHFQ